MTNEELAARIQDGETELYSELWENVKKLFYLLSDRYYNKFQNKCAACGVELEDIYQSCFLALHKAVSGYKRDSELKFTSYIQYSFKNAIDALMNGGHRSRVMDPLNDYIESLDDTLTDDTEHTKADLIPDLEAEQSFDNAEDKIFTSELHNALETAMQTACNNREIDVIRRLYWNNETQKAVAEALNLSHQSIHQIHSHALRQLRQWRIKQQLEPYSEFIKSHAYHGGGVYSFRTSGISSVERTVEAWEYELEKQILELVYSNRHDEARELIRSTYGQ